MNKDKRYIKNLLKLIERLTGLNKRQVDNMIDKDVNIE